MVTRTDAAAVGGAPYSAKASGGKATGGAKGLTQGIEVQFDFNAHEKGPRGRARYAAGAPADQFFDGTVNCFKQIDDKTVAFFGVVTNTNTDGFDFFQAWVYDGGEPGSADWFRVSPGALRGGCDGLIDHPWSAPDGVPQIERWHVTNGNIQVH